MKKYIPIILLVGMLLACNAVKAVVVGVLSRPSRIGEPLTAAHQRPGAGTHLSQSTTDQGSFSFAITSDMRYFSGPGQYDMSQYYRGALEALDTAGKGAFMISAGDIDPPVDVYWTITRTLGITYTWYPVVGNHELPGAGVEPGYVAGANMDWLRNYDYGTVNPGPSGCPTTTYSFDANNVHFVVLNEYCDSSADDVTDGDIPDHLYNWLSNDLSLTTRPLIFVIGHEPAYPQPDADTGGVRHLGDSLDKYPANRDRFWSLLHDKGVTAYICGHTHGYSLVKIEGVWQLDTGHSQGSGETDPPSTFVVIHVDDGAVIFKTYRVNGSSAYILKYMGILEPKSVVYMPVVFSGYPR